MAQVNILNKLAATYVGLETTFGTRASTLYRAFPVADSTAVELTQTEAENEAESIYLYDYKNPVRGRKGGSVKMSYHLRPYATQFSGSNAVTPHYLQQILKAGFGGHQVHSGSTAGAGTTTTAVPVDASSRFAIGQYAIFSGSSGIEVAMITNISGSTLSVTPALSAAPTSGSSVTNMDNFYPTEANTNSLTVQHAKAGDSSLQWEMRGCKVNALNLKLERDSIVMVDAELDVKTWSTGALGLSTAVGTETLEVPMVLKGATTIFQPAATTTRTHYVLESLDIKTVLGNEYLPDMGGTEGSAGVMRTGQTQFVEATVKFRMDTAQDVRWDAQTAMQLHCFVPFTNSSGYVRQIAVGIPTCVIVGRPKITNDGGRLVMEVTVRGKLNSLTASQSTELGRSPFVVAIG